MKDLNISSTFLITEEDFIHIRLTEMKCTTPKENRMILLVMGIIAMIVGTMALIRIKGSVYQLICWILLILIGLYCLSYYEVILPFLIKNQAVKYYRFYQKSLNSKTICFQGNVFEYKDEDHKLKFPLDYIKAAVESDTTFLIFTDLEEYCYIPKRALNEEQWEDIRAFLKEQHKYRKV